VGDILYTIETAGPGMRSFLERILGAAGFDVSFEVTPGTGVHPDFENPDILVKFSGRDVDLLLENKAELLLALEVLTMEALRMPAEHHSRLCFDANDYRMLRIEELRLSAVTAAEKVKRTRVPFHFSPMNSRERRILHLALRNENAVRSESAGVGPYRQVVIYPADMPTPPEPPDTGRRPFPPRGGDRGGGRARRRSA
jgi:spoIIIJ-associated protein